MKRIVALLLSLTMLLALASCGGGGQGSTPPATGAPQTQAPAPETPAPGTPEPAADGPQLSADGRYPAETIKIGFVNYDTTAQQVLTIQEYYDYLATFFNIEVIWSESLDSAEAEFAFIEQCAAAGCKAIVGYYNEGHEESVKLASRLGMYYWGQGADDTIQEVCGDDPMYIGSFYVGEADYEYGKSIINALVANDCHKIILVTGGKDMGVPMFVDRYAGMTDAIQEAQDSGYELEVVYEVPGWPGTEEFAAHQAAALESGADGMASALTALMWIQPMQNANLFGQIKVAAVDTVTEDLVGLMQAGMYVGVAAEIPGVFGMAVPMIINAVDGYGEQQRDDGRAALINCGYWDISSPEEMAYFSSIEKAGGTWTFDIEDVKGILGAFNPDFTTDDMRALYTATTMEEVESRRAAQ